MQINFIILLFRDWGKWDSESRKNLNLSTSYKILSWFCMVVYLSSSQEDKLGVDGWRCSLKESAPQRIGRADGTIEPQLTWSVIGVAFQNRNTREQKQKTTLPEQQYLWNLRPNKMEEATLNTEAINSDESSMKNIAIITLMSVMSGALPRAQLHSWLQVEKSSFCHVLNMLGVSQFQPKAVKAILGFFLNFTCYALLNSWSYELEDKCHGSMTVGFFMVPGFCLTCSVNGQSSFTLPCTCLWSVL